ncbi:helix-turn-helix transcriptional regulator [Brachybacterium alimentarium]|uniref:helix-turn-helix transcriptional regulator n=1 Tax=Brachybacterium alimentarium TaxID=47845 RepID=UPI003FCEFE49
MTTDPDFSTSTGDAELLTLAEAAEAARMSRRTLEGLIAQGGGPATVRMGRRMVRIWRTDLLAWIDSHREGGDAA